MSYADKHLLYIIHDKLCKHTKKILKINGFIVHGIGAACDIKFRPIAEVVDGLRAIAGDMADR